MGGGVRGPEVCNRLTIQRHSFVVVDSGHPVAVHAYGDCRLVDKSDLVGPKRLERVKRLNDAGGGGCSGDPLLVLLCVRSTSFDDPDANVEMCRSTITTLWHWRRPHP